MEDPGDVVLGVSADFHDASAAVVVGGTVVAAAAEERFSRIKHDPDVPRRAIAWCLEQAGVGPGDLRRVVFYEKPLSAYDRVLSTHATVGPRGFRSLAAAVGTWSSSKLWIAYRLERLLARLGQPNARVTFAEHHQSHAAAAYYPSPFDRAAILVLDGVGEWASGSIAWGSGHRIEMRQETRFPDSVGLFYSAMTAFCGFEVNDGEYKLMGLAPYGEPRFADVLRSQVVNIAEDGSVHLDQRWFDFRAGGRMTHRRIEELLGGPPHPLGTPPDERTADIARSVQAVVEEVILKAGTHAAALTGERSLCLAGGVALNCVANQRLLDSGVFDEVWIQPAAGDDGGAIGAALWDWHQVTDHPRPLRGGDGMSGSLLGPGFTHDEVAAWLRDNDVAFEEHPDHESLCRSVAGQLDDGAIVGWFQGAMEFGPRALGNRSILADPRDAANVQRINSRVKRREGFRPFAPAVLAEHASTWFAVDGERPYMTSTAAVHPDQLVADAEPRAAGSFAERLAGTRSTIPACTHVDGSARVQTVDRRRNPRFHDLLAAFHDRTGCPVLINTSFNRAGEPIVCTRATPSGRSPTRISTCW